MPEHTTIALSGKGGVGKTTVAALLVKVLIDKGNGAIFTVDADPNSCLADYLGVEVENTIGGIREETQQNITAIPPGMTKERWINYRIQECLVESKGMDLIEMGRSEGPGCYCYVNNLLRDYQDSMQKNYRYTIIDNEAGMEHLSRRTTRSIDHLLIVSDLSVPGLKAASRIRDLTGELKLVKNHMNLFLNKAEESVMKERSGLINETGLHVAGNMPSDPLLGNLGITYNSLMDIPEDSSALKAVQDLVSTMGL